MLIDIDDHLPSACLVTDADGRIVAANRHAIRLTEREPGGLQGQPLDSCLTVATRVFFQTHVWPTLRQAGEVREIFFQLQTQAGQRRPLYLNARLRHSADGPRVLWLFYSSEQRSQFEAELIEARQRAQATAAQVTDMAYTDSLTQLGNRRSLQRAATALARQVDAGRGFSVLMIDVDHFKAINDAHGHDRGDEVLQAVARCLQRSARQGDTVVRYGGEEFALVLPGADPAQALGVAERIHQDLQRTRAGGLQVTVSIGVATAATGSTDLDQVLKHADEALYAAKRAGRNRSVSHPTTPLA